MPYGCCARPRSSPRSSSSRWPSASAPTPRCSASSTACCCRACRSRTPIALSTSTRSSGATSAAAARLRPRLSLTGGRWPTSFDVMAVFTPRTYNVTPDHGRAGAVARRRRPRRRSSTCWVCRRSSAARFTQDDAEPGRGQNIVLSFGFWQRQFAGKPDIINQTVRLNGQPYTIVGVMPATLNFPDSSNFWMPAAYDVPSCGGARTSIRATSAACIACAASPASRKAPRSQQANAELTDDLRSARQAVSGRRRRTSSASRGRCRIGWSDRRARRCWSCWARSAACC